MAANEKNGCGAAIGLLVLLGVIGTFLGERGKGPSSPGPGVGPVRSPESFHAPVLPKFPLKPVTVPNVRGPLALGTLIPPGTAGDCGLSSIRFENQSGEPALVRLVGPTRGEVEVPNGQQRSIEKVAAGRYLIRVRSGMPGRYHYWEGDAFEVRASATTYSQITITLHPVVHGNYPTRPISAASFEAASPGATAR